MTSALKQQGITLNDFRYLSHDERQAAIKECMKLGEVRCFFCGRIIFKGTMGNDTHINVQCHYHKCKKLNVISIINNN